MMREPGKPIFAQALGDDWKHVAPTVRAHYNLRPESNDELVLSGIMSVYYPRPAFILLGLARLFGGLVLLREKNISVSVTNSSHQDSQAMFWHRSFSRSRKKKQIIFRSRMEYAGGDEIIEYVGANIGIRMKITLDNGAIRYDSVGYIMKIGSISLPLPGHLLLGKAVIVEEQLDENSISMRFSIRHPLWGEIYRYCGQFTFHSS